jgi:hypothetical protein
MKQFHFFFLLVFCSFPAFSTTLITGATQSGAANAITVTWGETDVNLGSPDVSLSRYQVSYNEVGQSPTVIDNISNSLRTYTISGLTYGKTYQVKVIEVIRINLPPSPFTPPFLDTFTPSSTRSVSLIKPNAPPVANCNNVLVSAKASCLATITAAEVNNGSSDPEGGVLVYSLNTTGPFGVGTHSVTLTVTDPGGLTSTCTSITTVIDDTAPTAQTKAAALFLGENGSAILPLGDVAIGFADNCGTISNVELSKTTFGCGDVGEQEITVSVSDNAGNVTRTKVKVTVKDNIPPLIIPQNQTFQLAPNGYATLRQETLNNMVRDNCSSMDVKADKVTFSCSDLGDNVVTITAKDESGNESGAIIIVTIIDTTPPIAYLKEATIYLDGNGFGTLAMDDVDNGSTDNCGIAQMELSQTGFNCNDLGEPEVTVFLLDKSGNSIYARAKVTVKDTLKPIVYIKSMDLFLGADGRALLSIPLIDSMITDNCGIAELEFSKGEFFQSDMGDNRVTVTATDAAGNQGRATTTVRVIDAVAPQVSVANLTLFTDANGAAELSISQLTMNVLEAGKLDRMSLSQTAFRYPEDSLGEVTLTAVDRSGNVGVDTFMVVLKDTITHKTSDIVTTVPNTTRGVVSGEKNAVEKLLASEQSLSEESTISFYTYGPNPTKGKVDIYFRNELSEVPTIKLTTISGRKVWLREPPQIVNDRTLRLDLYNVQAGVYLFSIQRDSQIKIVKIVKE